MQGLVQAFSSTTGRKYVMAVTGLAWFGFLVGHLIGNFQLLLPDGGHAFNAYGHKLVSLGPLLYAVEAVLAVLMITHVYQATKITMAKKAARQDRYAVTANAGGASRKTIASMSMFHTGRVILLFLLFHIWSVKLGTEYEVTYDGVVMRDLHRLMVEQYSDPLYLIGYMVIMLVLGFHLRHAIWSAAQSLGLNHPKWTPIIEKAGLVFAIAIGAGFFIIPIAIFLGVGQ
jgi:succinate dehydrogenase / fumarate reductase, cytochrome b subunit